MPPHLQRLANDLAQQKGLPAAPLQASLGDFFTHLIAQLGPTVGPALIQLIEGLVQQTLHPKKP
jgi:hypothetical protein